MGMKVADMVVVVTGASSGIGRATALDFAREGATVVATARRDEPLRELATQCEQLGGRALAVPVDVTDEEQVKDLARRVIEWFGRIDVWVNNAAVTLFGHFDETPSEAYRHVIETNLFGYVHGARAVLPYFREQGQGVLINVSSVVGKVGQPYANAYVTSKFAVRGFAEGLRQELRDIPGIHICTVLPAATDTPIFQHGGNYSGRAVKPMPPVNQAEEVARTIVECARKPRREVAIGGAGTGLSVLRRIAPGLAEAMMARQVEQEHFQDAPAQPTAGNIFEPMPEWTGVSGGWRASGSSSIARPVALTSLAALVALAVFVWPRLGSGRRERGPGNWLKERGKTALTRGGRRAAWKWLTG